MRQATTDEGGVPLTGQLYDDFVRHVTAAAQIQAHDMQATLQALWRPLCAHYAQPSRAYHTLDHIESMIVQLARIESRLYTPHLLALAIYYHDVIYEPSRQDNERRSAEYAACALGPYISAGSRQYLYDLILMTMSHRLDTRIDSKQRHDAAYLLDIDLSILGSAWTTYAQYANAIRQEYGHLPEADYRHGRIAVLRGLLARPQLYLTPDYYERLEQQARGNITQELTLLAA